MSSSASMFAMPAAKRARLTKAEDMLPVTSANEAITLYLLPVGADRLADAELMGHPEFTHQLFPGTCPEAEERIRGFVDLRVDIYFSAASFDALASIQYHRREPGADDLQAALQSAFPAGLSLDEAAFLRQHAAQVPLTPEQLGRQVQAGQGKAGTAVHSCRLASASQALKALHFRLEPLLTFFIDGATGIDATDSSWELLLATRGNAQGKPVPVGFATAYHLFAFPPRASRMRISQVLTLPHLRGQGIGAALLKAAYASAAQQGCADVLFEEPTQELQRLRERVDIQRALELEALVQHAAQLAAGPELLDPQSRGKGPAEPALTGDSAAARLLLSREHLQRLQCKLHIPKQQLQCGLASHLQAWAVWEAILYAQPAMRTDSNLAVLVSLIRRRLEARDASTRGDAESKRIFDIKDKGWIMQRVKGGTKALPGAKTGVPVALEQPDASAGDKEALAAEAVKARIQAIDAHLARLQVLERPAAACTAGA